MHLLGFTALVFLAVQHYAQALPIQQQPPEGTRTRASSATAPNQGGLTQRRVEEWIRRHPIELTGAGALGLRLGWDTLRRMSKPRMGQTRSTIEGGTLAPKTQDSSPGLPEERGNLPPPGRGKSIQHSPAENSAAQPAPPSTEESRQTRAPSYTLEEKNQELKDMSPEERAMHRQQMALILHLMNKWDLQFAMCFMVSDQPILDTEGVRPRIHSFSYQPRTFPLFNTLSKPHLVNFSLRFSINDYILNISQINLALR